ncbi:MAG: aldo/keto reductase [Haloferacaceae archaeon]
MLPEIGFGTNELRGDAGVETVRLALEAGYRHLDTARMYENEREVGRAVAESDVPREDVVVATKVLPEALGHDDLVASARESADRLGVDTIDLLYVHWPMDAYDPDETLPALDELVAEGLVDHVGLSNFTPDLLDEARARLDAPVAAHQVEMHPLLPQDELLAYADEHGHRLVAYCPLVRNEVTDVPEVVDVAERRGVTPAQASIAWVMAKGAVPIPRSGSPEHVRANLAAADVELTDEDVARIDAIDPSRHRRLVDPDGAAWNRE